MAMHENTKYSYRNLRIYDVNNNLNTKVLFNNNSLQIYCSKYVYVNIGEKNVQTWCWKHNHVTNETNTFLKTTTCTNHRERRTTINEPGIANKLNIVESRIAPGKIVEFEAYNNLKLLLKEEVTNRLKHYFYDKNNSIQKLNLNYVANTLYNTNNCITAQLIQTTDPNKPAAIVSSNAIENINLSNSTNYELRNILIDIDRNFQQSPGLQSDIFNVGLDSHHQTHNNLLSCISSVYALVQNIEHNIKSNDQLTSNIEDNELTVTTNTIMNATNVEHIMVNTVKNLIKDCICYSDCVSFSYCQCYGYCGCNYSDERLKNSILYISDIKKEF